MGDRPVWPYLAAAQYEFLDVADAMLVAEAHAGGHTVASPEKPAPRSTTRVKVPDVCIAVGVSYEGPFDVLRQRGLRLVTR